MSQTTMPRNSILALVIFTLLAVACGSEPTTTPSLIRESTQTNGPVLPTAQKLKQAGQELLSAFFTAVEAQDGATLHGLLVADIRERCTPEQVQRSLAGFDEFFPQIEVKAVYADLEDPNRAIAQVSLLADPETGLEGSPSSSADVSPFPMVQEDGQWRLDLPIGCPLAEDSSQKVPEALVTDWRYDGSTYKVVSGIAGDVPPVWVEHGWTGGGVLVYLSDQEVTCDDFPTEVVNGFPPLPTVDGATIWLKLTEKNAAAALDYASFDIRTSVGNSGLGTDAVRAGLAALEGGRMHGWLEYATAEDDDPQVEVSGTFDVPFCG